MTTHTELISILSGKEELMKELIRLLEQERQTIVDLNTAELDQLDEKKRTLLVQMEDSNNHFRQVLRQSAAEENLPDGANLSCLIGRLPVPQRPALQGLQARLLELGKRLDRALVFNRELLEGSLSMVNSSLGFFQGAFRRTTTYGYGGGMVAAPADSRLVCKEI